MKFITLLCNLLTTTIASTDFFNFRFALALSNSTGLSISWTSNNTYKFPPYIKYGLNPNNLNIAVQGYSKKYDISVHHHVTTKELKPNTKYFFKSGIDLYLSKTLSFMSPNNNYPLSIAVFGDMGVDNSENTVKSLHSKDFDLFLHIGDISYADDRGYQIGENPEYEYIYDEFMSLISIFSKNAPYMVSPGNHDISCHSIYDIGCKQSFKNFTAYNSRFKMPSDESNGVENLWYSYDFGPIHFVSINTESDFIGSPTDPKSFFFVPKAGGFGNQIKWLENDLYKANLNRDERPWIIVVGHRPLYNQILFDWPLNSKSNIIKAFEDIFLKYNIDFYIAGHTHAYERNTKIVKGEINDLGIYHITIGSPGCVEKLDERHLLQTKYNEFSNYKNYGFGELILHNKSTLEWKFHNVDDNTIDDSKIYNKV
jgi:predicted phosphodiesterase